MRKRKDESEVDYLEVEQKEVIHKLLKQHEANNKFFRTALTGIAFALALVKSVCAVCSIVYPFYFYLHEPLSDKFVSPFSITVTEWVSTVFFVASGMAVHPSIFRGFVRQWFLILSVAVSLLSFFIWVLRGAPLVSLIWLSGTNLIFSALCLFANYAMGTTESDILKLHRNVYSYKKA